MPARKIAQSSTFIDGAIGSFTNDAGRRSSRRIASRTPAPVSARTTAAPAATRAAAKRAAPAPASRPRAPASRGRGPATRDASANAGKRKRGAGDDAEEEEERPQKRRATKDVEPKKGKNDDAPEKRKRGAADDEEEKEEQRPKKRKTAKESEQQGRNGEQQGGKDETPKKRKRASDNDEEDGEEDEGKECSKKRKTGGKSLGKASATGKTGTATKAATTTKTAATKNATATTRAAATKKASRKGTKTNASKKTTTPTARLGQRAPGTRGDEEQSLTPVSAPAEDHTPQPIASASRPKSPPRRLTSIPPPEAWGPSRMQSLPKYPYTTPPPVPRGPEAPALPTHTPEGLPIRFPQPFNDPIPETIPEQTYEPALPFPNAEEYGYAPLGQRTRDHALRRQRATFLPPPQPSTPSECTEPPSPPPQPPVLPPDSHPPPSRNILMPTPRLPSQPGPGWLFDPTGSRARSPRGSHYRWYERRLHDWIPDYNVMPLWSAYQRQKHSNLKLFVEGRTTFFKHRPVDETEEAVRYGEYVPYTRQPLRRHEQLVQFGWVKLEGEEEREAECLWEQWRPRHEQPVASTSRLPEASTSELPEASSSRLPEFRVADADIEQCDTDIGKEVEEVTYVGKGKGRAL